MQLQRAYVELSMHGPFNVTWAATSPMLAYQATTEVLSLRRHQRVQIFPASLNESPGSCLSSCSPISKSQPALAVQMPPGVPVMSMTLSLLTALIATLQPPPGAISAIHPKWQNFDNHHQSSHAIGACTVNMLQHCCTVRKQHICQLAH